MNEQEIGFQEIVTIVKRNALLAVTCVLLGVGLAGLALVYLPARYKSISKLVIPPSYFQIPLIGDLSGSISDGAEQNAQRQALLRISLSDKFLDTLGEKYRVFKYPATSPKRVSERIAFFKSIEYFPVNSTTYQVSVVHTDPTVAFDMTRAVLRNMMDTLVDKRQGNLALIKEAIEGNVKSLTIALKGAGSPTASLQYDSLKEELEKINDDIRALTAQYTSQHPDVLRLQERAAAIRSVLNNIPAAQRREESLRSFIGPNSKGATQEVYNELVKKLNLINVVIDMEKDRENVPYLAVIEQPTVPTEPFFPPRSKILLVGLVAGGIIGGVISVFRELRRGTFLSPVRAAEMLGVTMIGELPRLAGQRKVRLIEGPGANAIRQYLPSPLKED